LKRAAVHVRSHRWFQEQQRKVADAAAQQAEVVARKVAFLERLVERLRPARRKIATAALAAITVWMGGHVMFGPNGTVTYRHKRSEARDLQQQINSLEKENNALSDQIKALQTDPKAIEKEAREQLHYAKPDEVIYVAPHQERPAVPAANAAQK
jgi:cell division protein FtsB